MQSSIDVGVWVTVAGCQQDDMMIHRSRLEAVACKEPECNDVTTMTKDWSVFSLHICNMPQSSQPLILCSLTGLSPYPNRFCYLGGAARQLLSRCVAADAT